MSHYTKVKTNMTRIPVLVAALQKLGFKKHMIEVFEEPMSLKGYMGKLRSQKAHVRIKGSGWKSQNYVGGASNDLGWEMQENGEFCFHVSDYDKGRYNKHWQQQLLQQYSLVAVEEECSTYGWEIEEEEVEADGTIALELYVNEFDLNQEKSWQG